MRLFETIAIAAFLAASCTKVDPKAARCRQIDAELTGCILSLPRGAVIQCKACIATAIAEMADAGIGSNDCGADNFEPERSCY